MVGCLFCGIVAGEILAAQVLESPRAIAFHDINPQAPVHVLIIPRQYFPDPASLAEAGDGLHSELAGQAARVAGAGGVARPATGSCSTPGRRPARRSSACPRTFSAAGR